MPFSENVYLFKRYTYSSIHVLCCVFMQSFATPATLGLRNNGDFGSLYKATVEARHCVNKCVKSHRPHGFVFNSWGHYHYSNNCDSLSKARTCTVLRGQGLGKSSKPYYPRQFLGPRTAGTAKGLCIIQQI